MARLPLLLCGVLLASPALAQTATLLDPNAAVGIQAGRFTIYPAVETTTTVANPFTAPGWSQVISPQVKFQGDWGAVSTQLTLGTDLVPNSTLVIATMADLQLQYDIASQWQLGLTASFNSAAESLTDAALPAGTDTAPNVRTSSASVNLGGPIGQFALRGSIGVVRNAYDDALVAGVPVDQSERNNDVVIATFRFQTANGSLLTPFVETTAGRRVYDQPVGTDGYLQAGNFFGIRTGIAYDSSPVLSTEFGIGYHWELPVDPALANSGALTLDGTTTWSPRDPLMFTLNHTTSFNPDASPVWGGSVSRNTTLTVAWLVQDTVQLTAQGAHGTETYGDGTVERSASAGLGVVWVPNNQVSITAGYTQAWMWSPDPTRAGTTGTFRLTARAQR